jgi:Domain of unknown function (DUF4331)
VIAPPCAATTNTSAQPRAGALAIFPDNLRSALPERTMPDSAAGRDCQNCWARGPPPRRAHRSECCVTRRFWIARARRRGHRLGRPPAADLLPLPPHNRSGRFHHGGYTTMEGTPRKRRSIRPIATLLAILTLLPLITVGFTPAPTAASSHRESPLIAEDPLADATDVYAFISPDNSDMVTLVANYVPSRHRLAARTSIVSATMSATRSSSTTMAMPSRTSSSPSGSRPTPSTAIPSSTTPARSAGTRRPSPTTTGTARSPTPSRCSA